MLERRPSRLGPGLRRVRDRALAGLDDGRRDLLPVVPALVLLALLSVLITLSVGDRSYDDAYITYRHARNLALGRGFVYNVGDPRLGTTTPLLTLLLALPARILSTDLVPLIGQWLSGLALFSCASLVYLLARADHKPVAGVMSALLVVLNPFFPDCWGGEALLLLALVLGGTYSYVRGHEVLAGVALALAYLTRGEGALAALVLAVHSMVVNRRIPWRAGVAFGAAVAPWTAFAYMTFGSSLPSTLQAKMAQMHSGFFSPFVPTAVRWMAAYVWPNGAFPAESSPTYLIVAVLAVVGGFHLLRRPASPYGLYFAWLVLYLLGYSLLGIPFYHWYMAPLVMGGILLAGLGAQTVWSWTIVVNRPFPPGARRAVRLITAILFAVPLVTAGRTVWDSAHRPPSAAQRLYSKAGRWLHRHTLPKDTVGYFEIGFIGYYGDRTMIDPVGLVTPGVWKHVAHGDFLWAYLEHQPDYLLVNSVRWYDRIGRIRDEPWFESAYEEVASIEEPGYFDSPLTVYRKTRGAVIPPPSP